jgi:hypothetical protein
MSDELRWAIQAARRAIGRVILLATLEGQLSAAVSGLIEALASRLPGAEE